MSLLGHSQDFKTIITWSESAHGLIRLCLFHKSRNKMSRLFNSPDVRFDYVAWKTHEKRVSWHAENEKQIKNNEIFTKVWTRPMIYTRMFLSSIRAPKGATMQALLKCETKTAGNIHTKWISHIFTYVHGNDLLYQRNKVIQHVKARYNHSWIKGNGYETCQTSLLYVFVCLFGLDPAQTIVEFGMCRSY